MSISGICTGICTAAVITHQKAHPSGNGGVSDKLAAKFGASSTSPNPDRTVPRKAEPP
jgi:hypothetical protein